MPFARRPRRPFVADAYGIQGFGFLAAVAVIRRDPTTVLTF